MAIEAFYTVKETGFQLKKSPSWVYRGINAGRVLASRVGASWRVSAKEIGRLLQPANKERVEAWTLEELRRRELKRDEVTIKALRERARWTPPG